MLSRAQLVHASRILGCRVVAAVQAEVLLESPPVLVVPAVLARQCPCPHQNSTPRASPVSRRLHCSPDAFLWTDLRSSNPNFVPTKCSPDKASRLHQQPLIRLFVTLTALSSWSGITLNIDSPNTHKADARGAPKRNLDGVLPQDLTVPS